MQTILATTYAVHPTKGSEDGMGWNYLKQIAVNNNVVAITRENNREAIEAYLHVNKNDCASRIHFEYFDLPKWLRFWKRGSRGALLYFLMWQRAIPAMVQRRNLKFDIAHNLNFHNDWTPSWLWKLNKPFVWGPIGHHSKIPSQYIEKHGIKHIFKNQATWVVKKFFWRFSFSLRRTIKHADFVYAMNENVSKVIPLHNKPHFIKPSVATQDNGHICYKEKPPGFRVISAGRFVPLKGFDLTINAFASFLNELQEDERQSVHLTLVGDGPETPNLRKLIQSKNLTKYITIIPWIKRNELMDLMKQSTIFLFPSHEGAGMVIPEALSFGLPILCLNNTGPSGFISPECGAAISTSNYDKTVHDLAVGIMTYYANPEKLEESSIAARKQFKEQFTWSKRREWLDDIYQTVTK